MKKTLLFLSVLFCFMACEPEQAAPEQPEDTDTPGQPVYLPHDFQEKGDYRDKYVGDYEYRVLYESMNAGAYPDPIYRDTTWYYSGTISIADSTANRILVHWGKDTLYYYGPVFTQSNQMIVDPEGVLGYPEYCRTVHMTFGPASIKNDTIRFRFTDGGAGSSKTWTVMGVKKD